MPIEKRTFEGGMNTDLAEGLLKPNQYRYALNIRNGNSERGAVGEITNAEGNQEFSTSLPSGNNKVIGAKDDEANDRVIYIVYNDLGDNRILLYDYRNLLFKTIVADSGNVLGLNSEYLISSIDVIVGEDTSYLLFTDNFSEPKNIDIEAAIRTYDTTYKVLLGDFDTVSPANVLVGEVYYRDITLTSGTRRVYYRATASTGSAPTQNISQLSPQTDWEVCPAGYIYGSLKEENFTSIVAPPTKPPLTSYSTGQQDYNYIKTKLFQFKTKYTRADGRESSWSPVSAFINPNYLPDSYINKTQYGGWSNFNNQIEVLVAIPDETIYKNIKIAIRQTLSDTSPSDWNLATNLQLRQSLDKTKYIDGVFYASYTFDSSTTLIPLDTDDTTQLMSWIPPKVKAQSVTARNRVVYGNFTEGKPYTLDRITDINSRPPTVAFFEEANPYNITNTLQIKYWSSGSVITDDRELFNNGDYANPDGMLIEFPATVTVGSNYAITVRVAAEIGTVVGGVSNVFRKYSGTQTIRAESTSSSDLIDKFVAAFNTDSNYVDSFIYDGTDSIIDKRLLTFDNLIVSGTRYLRGVPTAAQSYGGGSTTVTPFIDRAPTTDTLASSTYQSIKRGTTQTYAIAYSDKYGRLTTAIENPNFTASNPWWRDLSYAGSAEARAGNIFEEIGIRYAKININHTPPSWATKFHILKSNKNGLERYISFPLSKASKLPTTSDGQTNPLTGKYFYRGYLRTNKTTAFAALSPGDTSLGNQELIYIPLNSLQNSVFGYTNITKTPLAYDYVSGDRLRLCYNISYGSNAPTGLGNYYQAEIDVEILDYSTELNCLIISVNDLPTSLTSATGIFAAANDAGLGEEEGQTAIRGLLCEIYSPTKTTTPDFYYEAFTGDVVLSGGAYVHSGNSQIQTSAQSAIIELRNGDSFIKPRTYTYLYDDALPNNSSATRTVTYFVEEANYYDKVDSETWGAGRPNRSVKSTSQSEDITGFIGEVERPTTLRYTEPFLPDQGYNGLGTIKDINFKDTNPAMRSIQYLHTEGSRTIVFHENAVGFVESDRSVVTTLDSNNMTIDANTPLSDIVYYSDRAGIGRNPESFAFNNARKYFVDIDQGQVCRLSQNGIEPISNAGMNKYFKSVFRDMIKSPQEEFAWGAYDKRTDEYTITMKWNTEASAQAGVGVLTEDAGANIEFTVDGISGFNNYVGDYIRVTFPSYLLGGTYYQSFDQLLPITVVGATSYTLNIPVEYRSLINDVIFAADGTNAPMFIYPATTNTITYSEKLKAWSSFHSFNAEEMCSAGLDFVSFRAGKLYTHDDYDNPQSYYGVDYPAYIDVISNMGADQVKIWKTAALKATTVGTEVDEADFIIPISAIDTTAAIEPVDGGVVDSRGKISTGTTFVLKEGQLYSEYMRTGTGTSYSDFIEGDKVRGYWVYTRFKINSGINKIYKIISASFDFLMSNYTR